MDDFIVSSVRKGGGPAGLFNLGKTCFLNAVMQCLSSTKLKDFFGNEEFQNKFKRSGQMVSCTAALINDLAHQKKSFSPKSFVNAVINMWEDYNGNSDEDCWVFLSVLFSSLSEHLQEKSRVVGLDCLGSSTTLLLDQMKKCWRERLRRNIISFLFTIQIVTLVTCSAPDCNYSSVTTEENFCLHLNLTSANLKDCLKDSLLSETLGDASCPLCLKQGTILKERKLGRLPPYLIVQIKRFEFLPGYEEIKREDFVDFGLKLDVNDFLLDGAQTELQYELVGVVNHFGVLNRGHYTALCKRSNRWYTFDDDKEENLPTRKIVSRNAYMLWFELNGVNRNFDESFEEVYGEGEKIFDDLRTSSPPKFPGGDVRNFDTVPDISPGPPGVDFQNFDTVPVPDISPEPHMSVENPRIAISETSLEGNRKSSEEVSSSCGHPAFNLDVEDPILTPEDVPSPLINLQNISNKTVNDLKAWLRFRGCHVGGTKEELVKRVQDHIRQGKGDRIDPKADGGLWFQRKRQKTVHESGEGDVPVPILPAGTNVWKAFPSVHLPEKLTKERIEEYYKRLPNVTFSPVTGVVTVPDPDSHVRSGASTAPNPSQRDVLSSLESDDELVGASEDEDDPNAEEVSTTPPPNEFFALVKRAVMNAIPRGQRYKKAGHVLGVEDCARGDHYFVKAQVQASMEPALRLPTCTISKATGEICTATCTCKARALKRCGHISALLHTVLDHVNICGAEAVTCTGRACYWVVRPRGRNPGFIRDKRNYRDDDHITRRVTFISSPTDFYNAGEIQPERLQRFKERLGEKGTALWWLYFKPCPSEDSNQPPTDVPEELQAEEVIARCSRMIWTMNQVRKNHDGPFELPETLGQRSQPQWRKERCIRCTSSNCKSILGLTKDTAHISSLRRNVWGLDRFTSYAMRYGIEHEPEARRVYSEIMRKEDEDAVVMECGLWINPRYPQLACSPDVILRSPRFGRVLLEIKCLTQTDVDPAKFEEMPADKLKNCYLVRLPDKSVTLKKSHPYFYQVQMSLEILELPMAHFFVWSESGHVVCRIQRDECFFREKRIRLLKYHREILLPEYFLKRTIKFLPPLVIQYPVFHEDENDDYFLLN